MTAYVAEMSAAWHAWAQWGRPAHPSLRVVFAMLAGLAPLHAERLAARGGPAHAVHDPLTFFDTSSYGPRAIDAMLRVVGVDRLLYGSDRPVVAPVPLSALGAAAEHALTVTNPERVAMSELDGSALEPSSASWRRRRSAGRTSSRHSPDQRHYEELRRDDDVAVWLICWMDDHDTGFHDHDLSGGAVAVVAGDVAEDRLALGGSPVTRDVRLGRGVPLQRGGHPPRAPHRRAAGGDDPRLLAAAVAHGRLRGPAGRRVAPPLALLRRGVAPAELKAPEHLSVRASRATPHLGSCRGSPEEGGVSTAMERKQDRSPDVERAAQRLGRPRARAALVAKRLLDVLLALAMVVALLPLFADRGRAARVRRRRGWLERRTRLGRHGRPVVLSRFRELPGGAFGRALERIGARELPLLFAVLRGRLSFVGPRARAARHRRRPHRPAAADGAGADGAGAARLRRRRQTARSTTPTSSAGRCGPTRGCWPGAARSFTRACRRAARRPRACTASSAAISVGPLDQRRRGEAHERDEEEPDALGLGLREAEHGGDRDHGEDRHRLRRAARAAARATRSARRGSSRNAVGEPNSQYA